MYNTSEQLCETRRSNSTGAQYATWQMKIRWRKLKIYWFGAAKWFWPGILSQFAVSGRSRNKAQHLPELNVMNMIVSSVLLL